MARDVGFNVAAVDYLENIYQTPSEQAKPINFQNSRLESSYSDKKPRVNRRNELLLGQLNTSSRNFP